MEMAAPQLLPGGPGEVCWSLEAPLLVLLGNFHRAAEGGADLCAGRKGEAASGCSGACWRGCLCGTHPPHPPTQQLSTPWAPDTSRVRPSPPVHSCTSWAPASPDPAPDRSRSVGAELWFCVPVDPQAEDAERRNPSCRQRAGAG